VQVKGLTDEIVKELKASMTPSLYAANYLLEHKAGEEKIFSDIKYTEWNAESCLACIDQAYSGKNYTALTLAYFDGVRVIVRGYVWRKSIVELYKMIVDLLTLYKCGTVYMETNADKGLSATEMRKYWPAVKNYNTTVNKHIKIVDNVLKNWNSIYLADDCSDEYALQIADYTEGEEPDDAIDSLAALIMESKIIGGRKSIAIAGELRGVL
jgi:hypothetical protein